MFKEICLAGSPDNLKYRNKILQQIKRVSEIAEKEFHLNVLQFKLIIIFLKKILLKTINYLKKSR